LNAYVEVIRVSQFLNSMTKTKISIDYVDYLIDNTKETNFSSIIILSDYIKFLID